MILSWVVIFLVVALIAAFFGFGGVAQESAWIAKVLFFVFLVLFVLSCLQDTTLFDSGFWIYKRP